MGSREPNINNTIIQSITVYMINLDVVFYVQYKSMQIHALK